MYYHESKKHTQEVIRTFFIKKKVTTKQVSAVRAYLEHVKAAIF